MLRGLQDWSTAHPRLSLAALFAVTACASAAMVAVFVPVPNAPTQVSAPGVEPKSFPDAVSPMPETESSEARAADAQISRIAFVPDDALPLRLETLNDAPPRSGLGVWTDAHIEDNAPAPESENPDTWGTETATAGSAGPGRETGGASPAGGKTRLLPPIAIQVPSYSAAQTPAPEAHSNGNITSPTQPQFASLKDRLAQLSPASTARLSAKFTAAKAPWPPVGVGLIALKEERALDLYARGSGGTWTFVHRYKVLAASGRSGPKLMQGDKQVPEGVYGITLLNPNSKYHVSMRVNYPNAFDREMAAKDGRKNLGGDIMIHGKAVSIGCLAIGDEAAEELFVLAAQVGLANVKLVIAPRDLRREVIPERQAGEPAWMPRLYAQIASALAEFPAPPSSGLGSDLISAIFGK